MDALGITLCFVVFSVWMCPKCTGRWFAHVQKGYNEAIKEGQEIDDSECADDQETRAGDAA